MGRKLYVGSLNYETTSEELEKLFAQHGSVESAEVISAPGTSLNKGFGFVEMSTEEEAQAAIEALNGTEANGSTIVVNEAKPLPEGDEGRAGRGSAKYDGGRGGGGGYTGGRGGGGRGSGGGYGGARSGRRGDR